MISVLVVSHLSHHLVLCFSQAPVVECHSHLYRQDNNIITGCQLVKVALLYTKQYYYTLMLARRHRNENDVRCSRHLNVSLYAVARQNDKTKRNREVCDICAIAKFLIYLT